MKEGFLLGADVGSSSCKVVMADLCGQTVASGEAAYPTQRPRPGWVEQNPRDWYDAFCAAVRACVTKAAAPAHRILALSVTGPAHSAVLLDQSDRLLRPVIHWSDLRSTPQAERLEEQHGQQVFEISYQPVNPSWTLAQLLWVQDNEPETWSRLARILVQKDYVVYRLTGAWQTDPYDAIGTQFYDSRRGAWSDELCSFVGLDSAALPPVRAATQPAGHLSAAAAQETGLAAGTLVAVGSGDSVVEALGLGAVQPGQCIVKLATSGAVNVVTATPRPHRQTMTYTHLAPGRWYTISATNSGAASWAWFRQAFGLDSEARDASELDSLVHQAPAGSEGLIFHPYLQGERAPYWDPHLRGDFLGITPRHQKAHFARAVLEGVAYSLRDCLTMLRELGLTVEEIFLSGGGARSPLWRKITVNVLGQPLHYPAGEATALGAALLAGVAAGVYAAPEQAARFSLKADTLEPDSVLADRYSSLFRVYQHAARNLAPVYRSLAAALDG